MLKKCTVFPSDFCNEGGKSMPSPGISQKPSKSSITENNLDFAYFNEASPAQWLGFVSFPSLHSCQSGLDFPYTEFSIGELLFTYAY